LFALLDAENTAGVKLTENFAMWPGSSVSGLYFSHPESFYFGVGKIERDQVEDYAARRAGASRKPSAWLAPVLNYIPAQDQSRRIAREGSDADASTVLRRARQRRHLEGNAGASPGCHLRGASGVSQEGGKGGVIRRITFPQSQLSYPANRSGLRPAG